MLNELVNFIMYLVYIPIIIIIHELGHAAFVLFFGRDVKEISVGMGDELFRIKKFVVKKYNWWTGYCAWGNIDSLAAFKKLLIYLGGIIFNLITATLVWAYGDVQYADWYRAFIIASFFSALINIIPFKFPSLKFETDGLQCIRLLSSLQKNVLK